jgi:hypothetical protein
MPAIEDNIVQIWDPFASSRFGGARGRIYRDVEEAVGS